MRKSINVCKKELQDLVVSLGYILLKDFTLLKDKITVMCSAGHTYQTTYRHIVKRGQRCNVCLKGDTSTHQEVIDNILKEKGHKLQTGYINNRTKVSVICDKGHEYNITPTHIKKGVGCGVCGGKDKNKIQEDLDKFCDEFNFKRLEDYKTTHTRIKFSCKEGHEFYKSPSKLKTSKICSVCAKNGYTVNKHGSFYLVRWIDPTTNKTFIKFGITNRNPDDRFKSCSYKTRCKVNNVITIYPFSTGHIPLQIEKEFKNTFTSCVDKFLFPDGYTETFKDSYENLNTAISILKKYY